MLIELQTRHDPGEKDTQGDHAYRLPQGIWAELGKLIQREGRSQTNTYPQQLGSRQASRVMYARAMKGPQRILGFGDMFYFLSLQEGRGTWF